MMRKILTHSLLWLVRFYQTCISPFTPPSCRYVPTCSHYARDVLQTQPLGRAVKLIFRRLVSCHPWGGYGYDPPPEIHKTKSVHTSHE